MKKTIPTVASLLSFLIAPAPAFALFNGTFPTWVSTSSLKLAAGSDGQIQFNNGGDLSSDPGLTWNAGVLRIGGPATSDTSTITSGGAAASPSRISSNQLI